MKNRYFYGYYIVAAGALIQMTYLGCVYTFGVLFPELEREFGWSRTVISIAPSLFFLSFGLFGIFVGSATDRYGPKITLTVGGFFFGLGFLLLYKVESPLELYLFYGLIGGFGMAAHEVATLSTIARWFIKERGLMSGIVKAGSGLGQATIPLLAALLVVEVGWRQSCLILGLGAMVLIAGAAQIMQKSPQEFDMEASDTDNTAGKTKYQEQTKTIKVTIKEALSKKSLWILALSKFCDMFCLFTIITHIVPHGIDQGLSKGTAVTILATTGGCSIFGRIIFGILYDKLGPKFALMICFSVLFTSFLN